MSNPTADNAVGAPSVAPQHSPRGSMSAAAGMDPFSEIASLRSQVAQLVQFAQQQQAAQQVAAQAAAAAPSASVVVGPSSSLGVGAATGLKIRNPATFKGEMGFVVDDWITEMDQQFVFYGPAKFPTDTDKIRFALAYLGGSAMHWWCHEPNKEQVTSWHEFVKRLHARFRPVQAAMIARQRLDKLRQKPGHSVNAYANAFQVTLTPITDMGQADQVHHFVSGLLPHIGGKVYEKHPTDLRAAIDAAVSAEAMGNFGRSITPSSSSNAPYSSSSTSVAMDINAVEQEEEEEEDAASKPAAASSDAMVNALLAKMEAMEHRLLALASGSTTFKPLGARPGLIPGLTSEDIDRLRREGKCFRCKQQGHMKKDCPRRPKA